MPTLSKARRWILAGVLAAVGAGVLVWRNLPAKAARPEAVAVRTAKVHTGGLEQTIRLTGATAAERFAALLAPQLRGSRSGHGLSTSIGSRSSRTSSISGTYNTSVAGTAGSVTSATTSRTSSTSSSTLSGGGDSGGGDSGGGDSRSSGGSRTMGGSSRSMSMSRMGSSSRGGGDSGGSSRGSSGGGGGPSGGGPSGGGGGPTRGMGDFSLTLQRVASPGSLVKKGDVVAEFDRENMLTRLDDYRASMEQVEAGMGILESDMEVERKAQQQLIDVAKATLDKAEIDLKTVPVQGAITTEHLRLNREEAEANYKQRLSEVKFQQTSQEAQRRIADLERREARIELGRAEANAERMLVRAPMDGIVVMSNTIRGSEMATIQAGDMVFGGMMFMRVVDTSSMIVSAAINQADVELLRIGQKARVRFDAYPELELPAHVYSIGAMPRQGGFRGSFVKEVPVALKLDKLDPRIIPDLSVSVDVVTSSEPPATLAPLGSIFRDSAAGRPFVFLQRAQGWERREVELGPANNLAAVVRSGLQPGDVIAAERPPAGPPK